ncbi:MAG: MBL fold metallo-hydrolase [Oscillospiraceae bacterium]
MRIVTFASGSSGNCTFIESGKTSILIDVGISLRRLRADLSLCGKTPAELAAVFISHEHSDHVSGLASLVKNYPIPLYAPRTVAEHLRRTIPGVEVSLREMPVGEGVPVGEITVRAFHTPHDTEESVGYRVEGDKVFALATDMGCVTEEAEAALTGADAVLIEANHDPEMLRTGPYPYYLKKRILSPRGHLSNADCAALAARLADSGTKAILLGHLSRENNTPALAFSAVRAALADRETGLYVAPANESFSLEIGEGDYACR